jgi:small subunit ribosomal protein S9
MKEKEYYFGTGRRKSAVAQVRIFKGTGKILNIAKNAEEKDAKLIDEVTEPLKMVSMESKFDITYIVKGGGFSSQAEALRLALSRAISKSGEEIEKTLKKANLLSRDPREKERKKPGLRGARRAPQWAKR